MDLEQGCEKKDKRLLVLLAFGTFIMFSDITVPVKNKPIVYDHSWLEVHGEKTSLYRLKLPVSSVDWVLSRVFADKRNTRVTEKMRDFSVFQQGRPTGLLVKQNQSMLTPSVSPRLSFLLGQPFSINTAGFDELTLVPGVGPALAANIIEYREKYGPLTGPHQLDTIPGIGSRLQTRLQNYFTCSVDSE